jgi:hypothetical protein
MPISTQVHNRHNKINCKTKNICNIIHKIKKIFGLCHTNCIIVQDLVCFSKAWHKSCMRRVIVVCFMSRKWFFSIIYAKIFLSKKVCIFPNCLQNQQLALVVLVLIGSKNILHKILIFLKKQCKYNKRPSLKHFQNINKLFYFSFCSTPIFFIFSLGTHVQRCFVLVGHISPKSYI